MSPVEEAVPRPGGTPASVPATPLWRLWWAFFAYAAAVALLVQLVLLPHVFVRWHAGHGLLIGGDWIWFHQLATELAARIRAAGWTAWELHPAGQAPAGVAGAVYALTVSEPWTLIPLNAALHATAALVLLRIVQLFVPAWRMALWAVLPFALYPSAMTWYTQLHKDPYTIAGSLLFLYGWMLLARLDTWQRGWIPPLQASLWVLLGSVLAGVVRSFLTEMLQGLGIVLAVLLIAVYAARGARRVLPWWRAGLAVGLAGALVPLPGLLTADALAPVLVAVACAAVLAQAIRVAWRARASAWAPVALGVVLGGALLLWAPSAVAVPAQQEEPPAGASWTPTGWLPAFVDARFQALAGSRDSFRTKHPVAPTNIDAEVGLRSAAEVVAYVPRALAIVFLAPFPYQWFEQGSLEPNTVMRRIAGAEMLGVYLALVLLPLAFWLWYRRPEFWTAVLFCTGMMTIYGLAITNIGALYRYRYPFIMTLMAFSIAGALVAWQRWVTRGRQAGLGAGQQDAYTA